MKRPTYQRSVRFDQELVSRLENIASVQNRSVADVLRSAIEAYVLNQNALTESQQRQLRVMEFLQLALDVIIREQFPDFRDQIVANTDKRMSQYHGQR